MRYMSMKKLFFAITGLMLSLNMYATQQVHSILTQTWKDNVWQNIDIEVYTYNGNGHLINTLYQNWKNGNWHDGGLDSYTLNNDETVNTMLYQYWDSAANNWQGSEMDTFTYDDNENITSKLSQEWDSASWQNMDLVSYTYDENNFMITQKNQSWNTSYWQNNMLYTYTNNSNGLKDTVLSQYYGFNAMQNGYYSLYTYSSEGKVLAWKELIWANQWKNFFLHTYTYDNNGYLISDLYQGANYDGSWYNAGLDTYINNNNGRIDTIIHQTWDTNNTWQNSYKDIYNYTTTTGIVTEAPFAYFIFPNPTSDFVSFEVADKNTPYDISLNDIAGKQMLNTGSRTGNQILDFTSLCAGIYFLSIRQGNMTTTKKMVRQ